MGPVSSVSSYNSVHMETAPSDISANLGGESCPGQPSALNQVMERIPGNKAFQNLTRLAAESFLDAPDPDDVEKPDPEVLELVRPYVELIRKYFRAEVYGIENIPDGKALIVGNHNAGITFFEPFIMGLEWYNYKPDDPLYFLTHDAMVSIPIVRNLLLKTGSIRASIHNTKKALEQDSKLVVFPGGNYEAFRPFNKRNQVDFGGKKGFIRLALRNKLPIVPVCNVGGHETFMVLTAGHKLAKVTGVKKFLRSESFPVFLGLPWIVGLGPIFHFPIPAKFRIQVGSPIYLDNYSDMAARDPVILQEIYDRVTGDIQDMYDNIDRKRNNIFT